MTLKECRVCGLEKKDHENNFKTYKSSTGVKTTNQCKLCTAEYKRIYREENKEAISEWQKEYNLKNKDDLIEKKKIYYKNNSSAIKDKSSSYRKSNPDRIKEYRENNKKRERDQNKRYKKKNRKDINKHNNDRYNNEPDFKLRKNLSSTIRRGLIRSQSSKGNESCTKYLPYTFKELKEHLESQFESWMNWDNWGVYNLNTWYDRSSSTWTWQIDHIIPHCSFKYDSMVHPDFKKCWALSNLRPYSSKLNIKEGARGAE